MSTEVHISAWDTPEDTPGLTLSEARTNYVVSAMGELSNVAHSLAQTDEGSRIAARLEALPDPISLEGQYRGAVTSSILSLRDNDELPTYSPEKALRLEDKIRREEIAVFAGIVGVKFGFLPRYQLRRATHNITPVKVGWRSHEISLFDAMERRSIVSLHRERQALSEILE